MTQGNKDFSAEQAGHLCLMTCLGISFAQVRQKPEVRARDGLDSGGELCWREQLTVVARSAEHAGNAECNDLHGALAHCLVSRWRAEHAGHDELQWAQGACSR